MSEEVYKEYYRPIWRVFRKAHDHGECSCLGKDWWKCEGDCLTCEFHLGSSVRSLDSLITDETTLLDVIYDESPNIHTVLEERDLLIALFQKLETLDPEGKRICELVMQGKSERVIAEELNIPRNTYVYRKNKLFSILRESLKKYL